MQNPLWHFTETTIVFIWRNVVIMKRILALITIATVFTTALGMNVFAADSFTIATDTVFKPFEYTDEEGQFVGIDVDILAAIAQDQGFEYELKSLGWDPAIEACKAGEADGMIAGASITDERAADGWYFSDGYYSMTQCLAARIDEEINSFEDLNGKTVGVKNGTLGALYAEGLKDQYGFDIKYYDGSLTMYYGVETREVDACFEDTQIMKIQIQDLELSMEIVEGSENEGSPYGFVVFSEDKQDLLDQFNAGLANIVANGTYEEIIAKYLGDETAAAAVASLGAAPAAETEAE